MPLSRMGSLASQIFRSILFCLIAGAISAQAQTLTTLHAFTGTPDGAFPAQSNLLDVSGTLYGTTGTGGLYGYGTIFKLTSAGKETVLYSFTGAADGAEPSAGLTLDKSGNVYGTTYTGGDPNCAILQGYPPGCGVVFKFARSGHLTVLYTFTGAADGAIPQGLVLDASGNLYGPTFYGGSTQQCPFASIGCGVIFKLTPKGNSWNETVLYSFQGTTDGGFPNGFITRDQAGNIYGAAVFGGNLSDCSGEGCGVIFKVSSGGKESVLYSFTGGADGNGPNGNLLMDSKGNLYGTAFAGGDLNCIGSGALAGCGLVFEVTPLGREIVIHTFEGPDGASPPYGLAADSKGNGYGITTYGGTSNVGTVFEVTSKGSEKVLYSFTNGADGGYPSSGVIIDASGNLYSNTAEGGDFSCSPPYGCGTVFKLTP